ncbi:MAG: hypothetical protein ACXWRZ_08200, partial [Bdellovibrio sp.]
MIGKSRNVIFLAGVSLMASIALANNSETIKPAAKNVQAQKFNINPGGSGGFINPGNSIGRKDGLCYINKQWVSCSKNNLSLTVPNGLNNGNNVNNG